MGYCSVELLSRRQHVKRIVKRKFVNLNYFQQVEEISVRSSLFSSDVAKLLAVIMKDVRINKDVPLKAPFVAKKAKNSMDFRNKKIPPIIITFVQVCLQ